MNPKEIKPAVTMAPTFRERTWFYPWIGLLFGVVLGIFIGHPLSMLVHDFYNYINTGTPLDISGDLFHSFHWHMWPMMLIFATFGGLGWGFIGLILQRLRESRLRLDASHREVLKQTRYLNTYMTVSSMVAQCLDLHELLEAVLNVIMETVSAQEASVLLLDEDQANFQFHSIEGPAKPALMSKTFPADTGIAGSILQTQRSEVINDAKGDPRFYEKFDREYGFVTRNLIAIPLTAGRKRSG